MGRHVGMLLRIIQEQEIDFNKKVNDLLEKLETNKIFLYMVIHDLKHPSDSLQKQLGEIHKQLTSSLETY